ncbi:MAG TPA: hypothetical protein VFE53_08610, partial [Mucilaginibacter sp.]|nr:hypothetical protein [Mucilaginibacter sp.]
APKHDVLEDLAIARFLDEQFAEKINVKTFLVGIDTNPVIRRGIRIWVQQFLLKSKDEGIQFLTEALQLPKGENPIVDELLIGILGSDHCFELMVINEQLILANNLQIFDKLFQLAKLAYVLPYPLKNPKRSLLSIGPSWNALVKFLGKNYIAYKNDFDISLVELFQHWMLQFEVDDQLPEESRIVADQCLSILSAIKTERVIHNVKDVLEIFFWVIPVAQTEAKAFIDNIKEITIAKRTDSEYPIGFVRELNKLLIVDVYRCEKVYQYFPNEIIELAKVEWYSNKEARIDSSSYTESSFGLVSHPYNYFSASKYQTPFRFLFKYHFDQALQFLIELTNRGMAFYVRAEYTSELEEIEVILNDGQKVKQIGNYSLFSAYRGDSTIPYLIQSALMAFESNLLERAGDGETFDAVFQTVMVQSRTVLLTGVLISVATAYPFIFGDNIDALFKVRLLFAWDLTRYSGDYSITHHTSTIGNDFYYTGERHESNLLPHRRRNLEMLVTHRQLYFPEKLNVIIDGHLKELNPKDQLWQLALIRMDIRNTVPELLEDEQKIAFIPKPLPKDIQSMIDETSANQNHDVNAISIHLYANKLLKNEYDSLPEIDEWREQYRKLIGIDFKQVALFSHPDVELALVGIRFFSVELTPEELVYCIQKIIPLFTEIEHNTQLLKQPFDQRENDSVVHILPKLLSPEFADLVDRDKIKEVIKIVILFGHGDLFSQLITGIKTWAWDYDYEFAAFCFQLLLKKAYHDGFGNLIPRFYQKNESEQMQIVNDLKNEIEVASPVTIEQINLTEGDKFQLVQAFSLVPFHLLSNEYYPFLEEILKQLREFSNLEDYNDHQFVSLLEILLADFILFEFNDNTSRTVYRVLMLFDKHYQFVLNIFERITALAHDSNYPEVLWKQFDLVLNYFIQVSPKIAFLKILFLFSLHHPQTARKLNPAGPNKILHEQLISDAGMADRNITGDLFQLLAGIGSVYQPDSLRWLMKSFPTQEIYHSSLSAKAVSSMEKYVTQIFDTHLIYLKQNKDLLDYFILMLNALTTFGSRKAFRIRDIII